MGECELLTERITAPAVGLLLAVAAFAACQEDLTSPGSCPEYCPPNTVQAVDTVLTDVIVEDSTFRGYVQANRAAAMHLVTDSVKRSVGVTRFFQFSDSLTVADAERGPVIAVDSFRLTTVVRRRSPLDSGLTVAVHRIPRLTDSTWTFADIAPYLDDSTLVGAAAVPDSAGDTLRVVLPGAGFPDVLTTDSGTVALALAVEAPEPAFVDLGTFEGALTPQLERFAQVSVGDTTASGIDGRSAAFDSYVFRDLPDAPTSALIAGGAPSTRTLLRIGLPPAVIDSAGVVRATLLLVPAEPVIGAPGDSLDLRADRLAADFGPKSPIVPTQLDSLRVGSAWVPTGSSDTVRIDITPLVRAWQADPNSPRALMLRVVPEGASFGELRFFSSGGASPPGLHVTYITIGSTQKP